MVWARGPVCTIYIPGNVISATVVLVYINLQPEYELPSTTRFGQLRRFGKLGVGAPSSPATPEEKTFLTGSEFLFVAICALDLTSYSSINFRDRFPQIGGP